MMTPLTPSVQSFKDVTWGCFICTKWNSGGGGAVTELSPIKGTCGTSGAGPRDGRYGIKGLQMRAKKIEGSPVCDLGIAGSRMRGHNYLNSNSI